MLQVPELQAPVQTRPYKFVFEDTVELTDPDSEQCGQTSRLSMEDVELLNSGNDIDWDGEYINPDNLKIIDAVPYRPAPGMFSVGKQVLSRYNKTPYTLTQLDADLLNWGRGFTFNGHYVMAKDFIIVAEGSRPIVPGSTGPGFTYEILTQNSTADIDDNLDDDQDEGEDEDEKEERISEEQRIKNEEAAKLAEQVKFGIDKPYVPAEQFKSGWMIYLAKPQKNEYPFITKKMETYFNGKSFVIDRKMCMQLNNALWTFDIDGFSFNKKWVMIQERESAAKPIIDYDINKALKFYDNDKDCMIYFMPPMLMPMIIANRDGQTHVYKVPFPNFIVACIKGAVSIMFLRKRPKLHELATVPVYWPPLPNLFDDGHMCIQLTQNEMRDIDALMNKIIGSVWIADELPINCKPTDWPKVHQPIEVYEHWQKIKDLKKVKWQQFKNLKTMDQFLRLSKGGVL